jgi:hypothetical protein
MKSQWDCVLQNLGEWQGSFTRLSAQGEVLEDIPSLITLEGTHHNQTIHLVLKRFYPVRSDSPELQPQALVLDFSQPGAGALFFETGAFSEGSLYCSSQTRFGAELCLVDGVENLPGNRRLRLVQQFNADHQLYQLTLIREQRVGSDAPERPPVRLDDLIGRWQGDAVTLYPNAATPDLSSTEIQIKRESDTHLVQHSSYDLSQTASDPVWMTIGDRRLFFEQEEQSFQTFLLPDGATSTGPRQIQPGQPFFLEVSWLLQPDLRQRLIRRYNSAGQWISVALITENRVE